MTLFSSAKQMLVIKNYITKVSPTVSLALKTWSIRNHAKTALYFLPEQAIKKKKNNKLHSFSLFYRMRLLQTRSVYSTELTQTFSILYNHRFLMTRDQYFGVTFLYTWFFVA